MRGRATELIAERPASIGEYIQGGANLLWRIEAALVIERRRVDAVEKIPAATSAADSFADSLSHLGNPDS